ncbi:MAG: Wzy polymerase domain-containing protein [Limnohabitans sp.]
MNAFEPAAPRPFARTLGWCVLLVLPWLQPWSPLPLANVVPLLISWACLGLLMVVGQGLRPLDIARAWAWAALISSAIGLLQYFDLATWFSPWLHVPDHLGEAMGNLRQRNQLATLTAMGIIAVLWWHQHGLGRSRAAWMLACLALGNAVSNSRTGLLQMLLVTGLVIWWSRAGRAKAHRLSWRLALAGLGMYALAIWALPQLLSLTAGIDSLNALARLGNNTGCGNRKVLWGNVIDLIAQKPWLGWGWGELKYAHYTATYAGERFCDILGNAHNGPLHLAFVFGVPVATLVTLALLGAVIRLRPWRSTSMQHQLAWSVLAIIGLHSLLEFPLWYGPFQMAVLLCIVLLWPQRPYGSRAMLRNSLRIAGIVTIATTAFIAVDYARVRQIFVPAHQRWSLWPGDAMALAKSSVFFGSTADFAAYVLTPVTPENAGHMLQAGEDMLHYSPEPQVIRKMIQAARMVGDTATAERHQTWMKAAFPEESASAPIKPAP